MKSHIKMLKMALLDCVVDENCCSVDGDGAFALCFRPHPGGYDRCPGVSPGGFGVLGAAGIDRCINLKKVYIIPYSILVQFCVAAFNRTSLISHIVLS